MATTFYPPLSSIVPLEAIPEELGFVQDGLTSLLNKLFYKDFQYSRSPRGDAANYSLTVVSRQAIKIEIPGTGIFLILNPGHDEADPVATSQFPVTLSYEWGILSYFRQFDLDTFSFEPGDFFQLALTVLDLSERQLIDRALSVLVGGANPINQFVDDVNAEFGTNIAHPAGADPIGEVLAAIEAEPGLEDAGLIIFSTYLLDNLDLDQTLARLEQFFGGLFGGSVKDYLLGLLIPKIDASLKLSAGLLFPRNVLVPLDGIGGNPIDAPAQSLMTFGEANFRFSTQGGIGFDSDLQANLTPSRIGNTGFEILVEEARLDLSRTTNIPEATADGRGNEFVGVFIKRAVIKLPSFFNQNEGTSSAAIVGRNLIIGTGGLSGTLGLEAIDPADPTPALVKGNFGGGFEVGLSAVSLSFQLNAITGSEIKGYMKIPGFQDLQGNDAEMQIAVSIGADGDFSVTVSEAEGIRALRIPNVLDLEVTSLAAGRSDGRFFVAVSGAITFMDQGGAIGQFIPDKIEIQKLIIWEDGQVELEGGALVLPKAVSLKIGPVELTITAIHFGSHEGEHNGKLRQYKFFGFDGGLSLDPGGVDARGDGIKFYFSSDNGPGKPLHVFMRIQSITVDIIIPGDAKPEDAALLLKGFLAMKDAPGGGTEYIGGVDFSLPKLKMGGGAAMRYNPRVPAFLVDIGLELAAPIVLGATGLGIYGFRALVGMRYVASKAEAGLAGDAEWWRYYKAKVSPDFKEGIQVSKFAAQEGFSLGAGVSLATVPDAGRAFSSKLFFLLSLPEVFLLQGQGQILKQRIGLDTTQDPPFFAMIAVSSRSIETAFGVNYKIPDNGKIATITGLLEMGFFFGNSSAWYINVGRDQPEERRVSARLLTLFNSYFYLMLSSGGIRAGAGVAYKLKKKVGPFRVELGAFLDMAGEISFKPLQVGGSIAVGGYLAFTIWGKGFRISADASLAAEAPKPFTITGRLQACVKILWKKRCLKLKLTWTFDNSLNLTELEIVNPDLGKAIKATNITTRETLALFAAKTANLPAAADLDGFVVPMDSFIDLELAQSVQPDGSMGHLERFETMSGSSQFTALIPPRKGKSSQVRHEMFVNVIDIFSYNPAIDDWEPYDIYEAATPLHLADFVTADLSSLPFGFWQKMSAGKLNKLRILSQTPFSYLRQGSDPPVPEDLGISDRDVLCAPEEREDRCRDFNGALNRDEPSRTVAGGTWQILTDILYQTAPGPSIIAASAHKGFRYGLCTDNGSVITLLLPVPTAKVSLVLSTEAVSVTVRFLARDPSQNPNGNAPASEWVDRARLTRAAADLTDPVIYDDREHPVTSVIIESGRCGEPPKIECKPILGRLGLLEGFFNQLTQLGDLTAKEATLYPDKRRGRPGPPKPLAEQRYFKTFLDTPLYKVRDTATHLRYAAAVEGGRLRAQLQDNLDFKTALELDTADGKAINWDKITKFQNGKMIKGSGATGDQFDFRIQAVLDGSVRDLLGRSGYRIGTCREVKAASAPRHCDPELNDLAKVLLAFLDRLARNEHLLKPTLPLFPNLHEEYIGVFFESPLYQFLKEVKEVRYEAFWDGKGPALFIRIRDFAGYDCVIRLASLEPKEGQDRQFVPFDKIVRFVGIKPDPDAAEPGENFDFIIAAILSDGREIILRGRSCYPVRHCHDGCRTCLYRVCYQSVTDAIYNETLPTPEEVEEAAQTMIEGLSGSIQPIWRPDTRYAIRVLTRDVLYRHENGVQETQYPNTYVFGFRTAGPLGHYHKFRDSGGNAVTLPAYAALEAQDREDEFKLAGLLHYLDLPKCYPNADGRLTNAKPLFYVEPRLDLFYIHPYVYEMFRDWDAYNGAEKVFSSLELTILDPAPAAAPEPPIPGQWEETELVIDQVDVSVIGNMISNGDPCADVDEPEPIGVQTVFPVDRLQPLKIYTAVFWGRYRRDSEPEASLREVHRYVFQTSRYARFREQVESWILARGAADQITETAVYPLEVDLGDTGLNDAADLLANPANSSDDLKQRFADPFDRLSDGILELEALDPAITTEFNVVRRRGSDRILGILVRNPEPFNDPKMPAADLAQTLTLSLNGGPTSQFKALHARDTARVLITNSDNSMNMGTGTFLFTFRYKRYNGSIYVNQATVTAEITVN